jgi:hypothetical protein
MQTHASGGENDAAIYEYVKTTFGDRQKPFKEILSKPGPIMNEFPTFKDFQN